MKTRSAITYATVWISSSIGDEGNIYSLIIEADLVDCIVALHGQ
jgi:hypothetical protein